MKAFLKIRNLKTNIELPIESFTSVVIGRSSRSSCQVVDDLMSGTHCKFNLDHNKLEVIDLDSKNGTYLNGIRVDQSEVFLGDEIKVGGTLITLVSDKMDEHTISNLTFPGGAKARASQSLQLDFTGARSNNQRMNHLKDVQASKLEVNNMIELNPSLDKEVDTRIKAQSKIKLSKQQIKLRYKSQASFSSIIDTIVMILSLAIPLILFNMIFLSKITLIKDNRFLVLVLSEAIFYGMVYVLNYKILKFTIGEKISGIEAKYLEQ